MTSIQVRRLHLDHLCGNIDNALSACRFAEEMTDGDGELAAALGVAKLALQRVHQLASDRRDKLTIPSRSELS
jgi:hypothetical protein